jgi:hypothetical protein
MIENIFVFGFCYLIITGFGIGLSVDLSFFNPIRNYKKWKCFNIIGVLFFTILLHILLPHLAIFYWFYKLFTFGRKEN